MPMGSGGMIEVHGKPQKWLAAKLDGHDKHGRRLVWCPECDKWSILDWQGDTKRILCDIPVEV